MTERVVVTFRGVANIEADEGLAYLQRTTSIKQRFEAIGAALCAWGTQTFSFDLPPRALEAAIGLAAAIASEEANGPHLFRIGIAHGPMSSVERGGALEALSWGAPLFAATLLARMAQPSEVLVHPKLVASRPSEMLLRGTRAATVQGHTIRGARLDVKQPWRRVAARSVAQLREPELFGRDTALRELDVPPGSMGVIRAEPGAGGTRLLAELTARLTPSRSLLVAPVGASREPLGAIRRALSRAAALHPEPTLRDDLRDAMGKLLAGEGTDRWSAAALIDAWLAPSEGRFGVLSVDDAGALDATSLEVIAASLSVSGQFRSIIRLDASEQVPEQLVTAPIRATSIAGPLTPAQIDLLTSSFVAGAISPVALRRWAKRSGGLPLGVREALAEGMTSGDLCVVDGVAVPRKRTSGRGTPGTPRLWLERRMAYLTEGERAALLALAMLGGDASDTMIDALAVGMGGPSAHSAVVVESLMAARWVSRPEPGWLKLTSRTARDALLSTLSEDARRPWYLAAAGMLRHYGGLLGRADAAFYAAQAGDTGSAAELAAEAARAAEAASLESAAASLHQFALGLKPRSSPSQIPDSVRESLTASLFPPTATGSEPGVQELNEDPTVIEPPASADGVQAPSTTKTADGANGPPSSRPSLELDLEDVELTPLEQPARDAPAGHASTEAAIAAIDQVQGHLAELAKRALVQGDLATLEQVIQQLRQTGEHSDLVERLSSLVALGRGSKAEAILKLQAAAEVEQPPKQRARALLAYSVALASNGDTDGALLEALLALARTREARDLHGEEACARFLGRLSAATGHADAANAWAGVVSRLSSAARG